MAEAFGGTHRVLVINPYIPARTELIGTSSGDASSVDIGKPVKLSGSAVVLCAAGDEIYGFIESVNAGTTGGYSVGGVLCDSGCEVYATDADDDLVVGDLVVAKAPAAFGTASPATGTNVDKAAGTEAGKDRWRVMAKYTAGTYAGSVLLRKL